MIQEKFVFALVDYFNQTIVSNFNAVLEVNPYTYTTTLAGVLKVSPNAGIAVLDYFSAKDRPGTEQTLSFNFHSVNQ